MSKRDNSRRAHCQASNKHTIYEQQIHIHTDQGATQYRHTQTPSTVRSALVLSQHNAMTPSHCTHIAARRPCNIHITNSVIRNPSQLALFAPPPLPQETRGGQQARNTQPRHPTHNTKPLRRPSAAQRHHQRHQRSGRGASSVRAG